MNQKDQLMMFEPEGKKLAELVAVHNRTFNFEVKQWQLMTLGGFQASADSRFSLAAEAAERAAICETALQFEVLAGLS